MPDKVLPGPIHGTQPCVREAVCIHTNKIYDSCRDKECIEDLRVFPTRASQAVIDRATSVKCVQCELIMCHIDVCEVNFNQGFFAVDIRFFYKITAEAYLCAGRPVPICGVATYDKRVILFGSDGDVKTFSSDVRPRCERHDATMPTAIVEAVDPVGLGAKLVDICDCRCSCDESCDFPECINEMFDNELVVGGDSKRLFVSIGQFSIIKLERSTQLLIPAYDFCVPDKECVGGTDTNPCDLFKKINFPLNQFFPPSAPTSECKK